MWSHCIFILSIIVVIVQSSVDGFECLGSGTHCFCDEMCTIYGDCCYNTPSQKKTHVSCIDNYFAIDRCSTDTEEENWKTNCKENRPINSSQLINHVPVYGYFDNNVPLVYKNVFCAFCNGRSSFRLAQVRKEISLNKYKFDIPIGFRRLCYQNVVSTCPDKSEDVYKRRCLADPTFYIVQSQVYRNAYCYICNSRLIPRSRGNGKLVVSIISIDFNAWCLKDCQKLFDLFRSNKSFMNGSGTIGQQDKSEIMLSERVIVSTFTIISLTALLFLLFVYSCVEDPDHIASKITICMAASMFLSTLTNLIVNLLKKPSDRFCFYFSILHHYGFLSSFLWMSIFALNLYLSLTSSHISVQYYSTIITSTKLRIYVIIGYICPLVLIITPSIIQLIDENNILSAGFGERQCFINRLIGGLVWFFIPLCICLIMNVIICICLYRFIYSVYQQATTIKNSIKARKQSFLLCIKLSILFGVMWLPAFVSIFLDNYILKLAGGILSSLHGSALSICFIFGVQIRRKTYEYFRSVTKSVGAHHNYL